MSGPRVIVIGAGPAGLAAAMRLARAGAQVELFERRAVLGGRTASWRQDGFVFDVGTTIVIDPQRLRALFADCGDDLDRHLELRRVDPHVEVRFADGERLPMPADRQALEAEVARLAPGEVPNLRRFLALGERKLAAFEPMMERPFAGCWSLLQPELASVLLLRPWASMASEARRAFRSPHLRQAFSAQSKYLGMRAGLTPSLFSILPTLELTRGVWHVIGGAGRLTEAMAAAAAELGARLRFGRGVDRITVEGGRACGVISQGEPFAADAVVLGADLAHALPRLLPQRRRWTDRRLQRARHSFSMNVLHLGLAAPLPLAHHTLALTADDDDQLARLERGEPATPPLYLQQATVTDPSLAPPGQATLYVLEPAAHAAPGAASAAERRQARERLLARVEALVGGPLPAIETEHLRLPQDWREQLQLAHGAGFGLAHTMRQLLHRRGRNRCAEARHLYLVGGSAHPGTGLPALLAGAKLTARLVAEDLGLTR